MKNLRHCLALGLILLLSGCISERHFARDTWPFGNPNEPDNRSETALRALGKTPAVAAIPPQAGNVWPGPVQPMPTLSDIQQNTNLPLGQGYTPSLPSPYAPGQQPADTILPPMPMFPVVPVLPVTPSQPPPPPPVVMPDGSIYPAQPGGGAIGVVPPVPGDAR